MRVLALTNLYPNPKQPHRAAFNRQQFAALAREHEVRVIAPIAWTSERGGSICRHRVSDGMTIHHPRYVFTPKMLRGWYGRFFASSVRGCFQEVVAEFRPDVVLGCWAYPDGWAAVRLAREAGLPVAIKVHGSDLLTLGNHPARRRRTAEALTGADGVIAVSRHLGERAATMGASPSRVHVVYCGVNSDVFFPTPRGLARQQLGVAGSEPLILFAGNLIAVKGLDVLLDALASVTRTGRKFQCVIAGEGPLRGMLLSKSEALGLGSCVRFIGARPHKELALWYQSANLFVLPSRSEGLPNVLLEASACGTPFIATSVGGIPELAHTDALVPPGNAAALAEKIGSFLGDGANQVTNVAFRSGSWTDSARALAEVLGKIVERTPGQALRAV